MSNQRARLGVPIPEPVSQRINVAADAMSKVMAHVNLGALGSEFERALAGLRAVQATTDPTMPRKPPRVIFSSIAKDDGGERPAYCLMLGYLSDIDAVTALATLSAAPHKRPVGYLRNETEGLASLEPLFLAALSNPPRPGAYNATYRPVYDHPNAEPLSSTAATESEPRHG